jgi:DDE domain
MDRLSTWGCRPARDDAAARRFSYHALSTLKVTPVEVITDAAPVCPAVLDELVPSALHHREQYANNPVEADHGLKHRLRPLRGLRTDSAQVFLAAPISYDGLLVPCAGRVVRAAPGRDIVGVHDYPVGERRSAPGIRLLDSAKLRSERPGQTCVSMPLGHLTTGGQGVVGSNPAVPTRKTPGQGRSPR